MFLSIYHYGFLLVGFLLSVYLLLQSLEGVVVAFFMLLMIMTSGGYAITVFCPDWMHQLLFSWTSFFKKPQSAIEVIGSGVTHPPKRTVQMPRKRYSVKGKNGSKRKKPSKKTVKSSTKLDSSFKIVSSGNSGDVTPTTEGSKIVQSVESKPPQSIKPDFIEEIPPNSTTAQPGRKKKRREAVKRANSSTSTTNTVISHPDHSNGFISEWEKAAIKSATSKTKTRKSNAANPRSNLEEDSISTTSSSSKTSSTKEKSATSKTKTRKGDAANPRSNLEEDSISTTSSSSKTSSTKEKKKTKHRESGGQGSHSKQLLEICCKFHNDFHCFKLGRMGGILDLSSLILNFPRESVKKEKNYKLKHITSEVLREKKRFIHLAPEIQFHEEKCNAVNFECPVELKIRPSNVPEQDIKQVYLEVLDSLHETRWRRIDTQKFIKEQEFISVSLTRFAGLRVICDCPKPDVQACYLSHSLFVKRPTGVRDPIEHYLYILIHSDDEKSSKEANEILNSRSAEVIGHKEPLLICPPCTFSASLTCAGMMSSPPSINYDIDTTAARVLKTFPIIITKNDPDNELHPLESVKLLYDVWSVTRPVKPNYLPFRWSASVPESQCPSCSNSVCSFQGVNGGIGQQNNITYNNCTIQSPTGKGAYNFPHNISEPSLGSHPYTKEHGLSLPADLGTEQSEHWADASQIRKQERAAPFPVPVSAEGEEELFSGNSLGNSTVPKSVHQNCERIDPRVSQGERCIKEETAPKEVLQNPTQQTVGSAKLTHPTSSSNPVMKNWNFENTVPKEAACDFTQEFQTVDRLSDGTSYRNERFGAVSSERDKVDHGRAINPKPSSKFEHTNNVESNAIPGEYRDNEASSPCNHGDTIPKNVYSTPIKPVFTIGNDEIEPSHNRAKPEQAQNFSPTSSSAQAETEGKRISETSPKAFSSTSGRNILPMGHCNEHQIPPERFSSRQYGNPGEETKLPRFDPDECSDTQSSVNESSLSHYSYSLSGSYTSVSPVMEGFTYNSIDKLFDPDVSNETLPKELAGEAGFEEHPPVLHSTPVRPTDLSRTANACPHSFEVDPKTDMNRTASKSNGNSPDSGIGDASPGTDMKSTPSKHEDVVVR